MTEVARRIKRGMKRRETDPASSQFPKSVLHSLEHTKRFTESGREEKGEGGDRDGLLEKKESPKEERVFKPVISLPSKNGTEDCVLKDTKLITNSKKQRLKI